LIIFKILVYIFNIFYLFVTQNVLHSSPGLFDDIFQWQFFLERDISMIFCGHKHIIITYCY
jgi:hypothetical protein